MKAAVVTNLSLARGDKRLDASYHASDGARARSILEIWQRRSGGRLNNLQGVCLPGGPFIPSRFKRIFVEDPERGAPYLTGGDILLADPISMAKRLSHKYTGNMDELALREKMILITCSGSIGNTIYVNGSFHGAIGSPDLIRVLADPSKIQSGYLYACLSSPISRSLIQQSTYGAVIPHIEAHHVYGLPVPRLGDEAEGRIHALIERAAALKTEAAGLIEAARAQLFERAGLPRLSRKEALTKGCHTFVTPSSRMGMTALTAWTYNTVTQRIIAQVQKANHSPLGSIVLPHGIFYGHQFKRLDADPSVGIMLLSQGDVFQERPQGRWISKKSVPDYREYLAPDGAILFGAQGTMGENELYGRCQFSHRNFEGRMITQHILRVLPDPKLVNPGYLYAYLSSEYGFQLIRSTACGTKLLGFILGLVAELPVPMLPRERQDEIGGMIYQAYDQRAEALALEDQAQALLAEGLGIKA